MTLRGLTAESREKGWVPRSNSRDVMYGPAMRVKSFLALMKS